MTNLTKVFFTIVASLIGAGFASGQEINIFFFCYGKKGILGLFLCFLLLSLIIYKTFKILENNNINTYKELLNHFTKKSMGNNFLNFSFILNTIVNLFLLLTFFVMITGCGAFFAQELGLSNYLGSFILTIVCFITFMTNVNGMLKINSFIIPILLFFIILIGFLNIDSFDCKDFVIVSSTSNNKWILSSILYCSYNSILLIPMLIPLHKYITNNTENIAVSMLCGFILFILALSLFSLLARINTNISNLELPVLYVIRNFYPHFRFIYSFIILASIYTTANSIGISFLENTAPNKKCYILYALLICTISFLVSGIGFSNLITLIYPVFGYLGLLQISAIIRDR